ncbi:MAG: transposase family protein [Gammaproteobacteria bacterium]|nr:MAG: transposase family protein [Gammaproteobacteria bacterium]
MLSRNTVTQETIEEDLITINLLHEVDLKQLQAEDETLKPIILAIQDPTKATQKYINIAKDYKIQHGILYRKFERDLTVKYVIALPKSLHQVVLEEFHDSKMTGAHLNSFKVLKNLQERFHWFGMKKDTENYVRTCESCQKRKYVTKKPYGLFQGILPTNKVFERLQTDIIGPLTSSNRYKYILTVTESTTRYGFAFPLVTADSKSIAKCLIQLFCTYGISEILQSDMGTEFTSSIIQQLNLAIGTCHIFASSFTPHFMGQVEKLNGTLCTLLSHFVHNSPNKWSNYLPYVLFAYNNSVNQVTGYRPAYLLFGYNPRFPSDTIFITPQADKDLLENLKIVDEIRNTIPSIIKEQQKKQKKYYDKARRDMPELKPGTEVLIAYPKNLQLNPSKFSQKYRGPAVIIKKATPVSYVCEFIKYGKLTQEVVHVCRMKLYHSRQIE